MAGNKKFDIDLKYGQIREQKVKEMSLKDYRALYKLSTSEPLVGAEAEIYLSRFL